MQSRKEQAIPEECCWREIRRRKNICSMITRKIHKYSTETDGCRMLRHQFSTTSLSLLAYYIKRCSTCWLRMNQLGNAILLFSSTDDQDQNTRTTVFPLNCGRQSYIVWWSRKSRYGTERLRMESRMKRSVASWFMSIISIDSKKHSYAVLVLRAETRQRPGSIRAYGCVWSLPARRPHLATSLSSACRCRKDM